MQGVQRVLLWVLFPLTVGHRAQPLGLRCCLGAGCTVNVVHGAWVRGIHLYETHVRCGHGG